jgi:hypothetical protein
MGLGAAGIAAGSAHLGYKAGQKKGKTKLIGGISENLEKISDFKLPKAQTLKRLAIGLGLAGLSGGSGYLGYKAGHQRGQLGILKKLHEASYQDPDSMYIMNLLRNTPQPQDRMMKISEYAFRDELAKIATVPLSTKIVAGLRVGGDLSLAAINKAKEKLSPSYIAGSYKNLGNALSDLKTAYVKKQSPNMSIDREISSFGENLSKSKMALGTTAVGLSLAKKMISTKKKDTSRPYYSY